MNPIFQIVVIAYLFLVVPFLTGVLEAGIFRKEKKSVSEIFTNGYLLVMAIFCVVAVAVIQMEQPLSGLARVWLIFSLILSVLAVVVGRNQLAAAVQDVRAFWHGKSENQDKTASKKIKCRMLAVMVVSVVLSIGFTKPAGTDATVEIVNTSVATDSMYVYDEYTGYISEYAAEGHVFSPIEMFYAVGVMLTGMTGSTLVYYVLPAVLLLFFFLGVWRLGRALFEKEEQVVLFELIVVLIYWMTTYMQGQSLVTGIFLNSWNGLTLLSCVVLPLVFSQGLAWMKAADAGIRKMPAKVEQLCLAMVLVLAGQLTHDKGGFYVILMIFLCIAVILAKGGYEYGITFGRFKKRV